MFLVKFNCFRVVFNRTRVLSLLPKREAPVVIKVSVIRFQFNRLREGFNGFVKISLAIQTDPLVIVSERVSWVDTDRSGVILNGSIELSDLIKSETSIE